MEAGAGGVSTNTRSVGRTGRSRLSMSYDQDRQSPLPRFSRRAFVGGLTVTATAAFLAACGSTSNTPAAGGGGGGASAAPAASAAASTAPAAAGTKKDLIFWGREQFLPESNDYLRESVQMAAQKGNFNVRVELFTNDEHAQKEVVAFESGILPDITYTYAPARWNSSGKALEVGAL